MNFELGPHQTLLETSIPWNFDVDQQSHELSQAMIDFMINNHGIGLAANQLGMAKRVFVMGSHSIPEFPKPFAVFNPKILEHSQKETLDLEGCLSYPGLALRVKRPESIVCEYQDADGNTHQAQMTGYVARCFQHELDHLDGVCFVNRVSKLKLDMAMKKLRKKSR